jgi:hypothetical protein
MNMSRAVLRQLLGAGLVRAVTSAALGPKASEAVIRVCRKLDKLAEQGTDFAMAGQRKDQNGKWLLDAKAERQRQRALQALTREVGLQYGEQVDVRDITTAAMCWIEELRDQLPVWPVDRRIVWADVAGGLQELYDLYDPENRPYEEFDPWVDRAETFKRASGVW